MANRDWNVYRNSDAVPDYSLAHFPPHNFPIFVAGPFTWAEGAKWMRDHGVPGWEESRLAEPSH